MPNTVTDKLTPSEPPTLANLLPWLIRLWNAVQAQNRRLADFETRLTAAEKRLPPEG